MRCFPPDDGRAAYPARTEKGDGQTTGKDKMKNKVIDLLEQKQLRWSSSYVDTTGRKFVDLLTDVLWCLDGCHKALEGRRLSVPHVFSEISGFNKPESHAHKRVPMEATRLRTFSTSLFKILPTCSDCYRTKPKVLKRKRSQIQPASKKKQRSTQ